MFKLIGLVVLACWSLAFGSRSLQTTSLGGLRKHSLQSFQNIILVQGNLIVDDEPAAKKFQSCILTQPHKLFTRATDRLQIQLAHIRVHRIRQPAPDARPDSSNLLCHFVRLGE